MLAPSRSRATGLLFAGLAALVAKSPLLARPEAGAERIDGGTSYAFARTLEVLDLYVASGGSDQILRYDGLTGDPLPVPGNSGAVFVPASPGPRGVVFGPKEDLWIVNSATNSVDRYSVLDAMPLPSAGNAGATFVPPGAGGLTQPIDLVFGPDRNGDGEADLYVTDNGPIAAIYVYDGRTGQFLSRFGSDPSFHPSGITVGLDGHLYVTSFNEIRRYDGESGVFLGVLAADPAFGLRDDLAFGPDGHLYVSNGAGDAVHRYDEITGADLGDFVAPGSGGLLSPAGLAWGPDISGDRVPDLFVASAGTDSVKAYSGVTGSFLRDLASGGGLSAPTYLAFRPGEWRSQLDNPGANYLNVADAAFSFFRKYGPNGPGEDDEELFFLRYDYFMRSRVETVEDRSGQLVAANASMKQFLQNGGGQFGACPGATTPPSNWSLLGPSNVPPPSNPNLYSATGLGMVRSIALDTSSNPWLLYAGASLGGLWRTPYSTAPTWTPTWTNLTDASGLPSTIAVTSIVLESPSTIYISTGWAYGVGLLKSTNGGATWTNPLPYNPSQEVVCGQAVLDPNSPGTVYVSCSGTLFRLVGTNPTTLFQWPPSNYGCWWLRPGIADLEVDANNGSTVLYVSGADNPGCSAGADQMWRITNPAGAFTVTTLPSNPNSAPLTPSIPGYDPQRIEIAVSAASPAGTLWRLLYDQTQVPALLLQKSVNFGGTWTAPGGGGSGSYQALGLYGVDEWTMRLAVSAVSPSRMYLAGIEPWLSTDGGLTFNTIDSQVWNAPNWIHTDMRTWLAVNNAGQDLVFSGNDGGIFQTNDQGTTWKNISNGLPISLYYGLGGTESIPGRLLVGAQDKSSDLLTGGLWTAQDPFCDGGDAIVDYADPLAQVLYTECNGALSKSVDGGTTWSAYLWSPPDGWRLGTPLAIDPADSQTLYVGSRTNIWKTTNGGQTLGNVTAAYGPMDNNGNQLFTPEAIAVAPSNHNILYFARGYPVAWYPPRVKRIFRSSNGGATWIDQSANFVGLDWTSITDIAIDPKNPDRIWASLSGFWDPAGGGWRVGYSPDGGSTWFNVSAGLPNFPVAALAYQKCSDDAIYAATDVGVYRWDKTAQMWKCWSYGLPVTNVTDLEINYATWKIRASTYGRAVWESPLPPPTQWPCGPCSLATPSLSGPTDVCNPNAVYTSDGKPGIRYTWKVVKNGQASWSAGASVSVTWGPSGGIVTVYALDLATGCVSAQVSLTVNPCVNGQVSGKKLEDSNHDGTPDSNPLAGWTIQATSSSASTSANPVVTSAIGLYSLSGLQIGTHTISEVGQPGWVQTYPAGGSYSVSFSGNTTIAPRDFANYSCPAAAPPSGCIAPPLDMIAWWPMDYFVDGGIACSSGDGQAFTPDIVRGKEDRVFGSPSGSTSGNGCLATPLGLLGGAVLFDGIDDFVEAPDQASLNFGAGTNGTNNGNFSIEAWIHRPSLDGSVQMLVDKRREDAGPTIVGYAFFLANDRLFLQLADGVGGQFSNYDSGLTVPPGWHHVAVTVDRDQANGILFYLDNGASIPQSPLLRTGSLGNTIPLRIGRRSDSSSGAFFNGRIDELEIFRRVLLPNEIQALYNSGQALQGKCKQPSCHLPASTGLTSGQSSALVSVTVCNNTGSPDTFRWSLAPSAAAGSAPCQLAGPTTFQPPAGTIALAAGECADIPVTVSRPNGFVAAGRTACYEVTAVPNSGNECFSCRGSLADSRPWETRNTNFAAAARRIGVGQPTSATFDVENTGSDAAVLFYALDVLAPGGPNLNVSVNGLPPGSGFQSALALDGGQTTTISADVSFLQHEPFRIYDLVLSGDTDGDGQPDTSIGSIGLRSVLEDSAATACDASAPSAAITQLWTSRERFGWNRLRDCDGVFNVYRQTGPTLTDTDHDSLADAYGDCFLRGLTTPEGLDATNPATGWAHFYLVTGRNGFGEGSLGTNRSGLPRPNHGPCP